MTAGIASASSTLVTVKKTDGRSQAYSLDPESTLDTVRTFLTGKKLMNINDSFLADASTEIDREQESSIPLSEVLKDKVLMIGTPTDSGSIGGNDGVARYNLLNDAQKRAIFDNIEIFRGLSFGDNAFGKTFKNVYGWSTGYMPAANSPRVTNELISSFAFNKATSEVKTFSSNSTSVNFSSPYGSAEAEYKTEKSKTTTTSKVKEYLTTKYIVRKADLQVDPLKLTVSPDFVAAVKKAIKGKERSADGYYNLIAVLNEYGYYVPVQFTLGGAILGSDETEISEFSQAESEKREFNASFKAEFEGIGGGAAYRDASGTDKTTTNSSKYQNIALVAIGGKPGLEKDYPEWAKSLEPAINWKLADVAKFWPTLELLARDEEGKRLLTDAITLIEKFSGAPNSARLQPFLDMRAYNTNIQALVNPFAD